MKETTSYTVSVELPVVEAYALAHLCKRIGWRDAESLAVDRYEARNMLDACDRVRDGLAHVGVIVR